MRNIIIGVIVIILIILGFMLLGGGEEAIEEIEEAAEEIMDEMTGETEEMGNYAINTETSTITWTGSKRVGHGHSGTVALKSGSFTIDEEGTITAASATIDFNTIDCCEQSNEGPLPGLVEHLMNEDFFDVTNHPEGMFKLSSVEVDGDTTNLIGDLTIKDITNEVTIPATVTMADDAATITADLTLDRSLWEIRYGSESFFDDLGDKVIENDMELTLEINLTEVEDEEEEGEMATK